MSKNIILSTPNKSKKTNVPDSIKQQLKNKAESLVELNLKPLYIMSAPATRDFNKFADIYCKWSRNSFYFCASYNSPSTHEIVPAFETKFARMEYVSVNTFNLSYMQHTGLWFEMFQNLTTDECLKLIQNDPIFKPNFF